jgi:hypothetical protein
VTKGNLGEEPITIKHFQYRNLNRQQFTPKDCPVWPQPAR